MQNTQRPLNIFIFSHPRTGSHVLFRLLTQFPEAAPIPYPFNFACLIGRDRPIRWGSKHLAELIEQIPPESSQTITAQNMIDLLETVIGQAHKYNRIPVIKDHPSSWMKSSVYSQHLPDAAPGSFPPIPPIIDHYLDITNYTHLPPDPPLPVANPTLIPDRLFRTLTPVFTIRHPAHAIPSWYRSVSVAGTLGVSVGDPEWLVITSFLWPRLTFDCFRAHFIAQDPDSRWPVVIDADDLIGDPEGIMRQLCALTGLNPEHISTTWTRPYDPLPVPEDHFMYPLKRALFGSVIDSKGITTNPNLEHPPDVTTERQKWVSQWGENIADAIARAVDGAMADYQYLYGFRLLPNITK